MRQRVFLFFAFFLMTFQVFAIKSNTPRLKETYNLDRELSKIEQIVDIQSMESTEFSEKYLIRFTQPIDYNNPAKGSFTQRVFVSHVHPDSATVVVTEGYLAQYAARTLYREEISKIFNTNLVVIEHRYFAESVPTDLDWKHMNAVYSANDHHNVVTALKSIYKGKWIADGISKGGQTSLIYRTYYPEDVDITVPYVAPLCRGLEDGRHEPFLSEFVGTQSQRDSIEAFQIAFLKRKAQILPLLDSVSKAEKLSFSLPLEEIYDYMTLEFPFALWQWGTPVSTIPGSRDREMFNYMLQISHPSYFTNQGPTAPFFVQAAKELGYYGYDIKPFKGLLSIDSSKGYLAKMMLPDGYRPSFDKYLYKKCSKFLKTTDAKILFIYGEYDPWSAVRVPDSKKDNIKIYIDPKGSHRARISTFPEETKQEIISILKSWLYN